ncbi:hypothetical protein M422DRAFT_54845 [Sphaerobolus stellatus SS14]|uniref:Uncharacterized protein n=1 Tax=Sphaerobolus stellatus (strain SS14) TaxID=990650 RepID=A0A0C9U1C1_SPHS4|nr:hypothetical protein M422DRAFT_54845 [Sphaerobolus stellatus SS14]
MALLARALPICRRQSSRSMPKLPGMISSHEHAKGISPFAIMRVQTLASSSASPGTRRVQDAYAAHVFLKQDVVLSPMPYDPSGSSIPQRSATMRSRTLIKLDYTCIMY